MAVFHVSYVKLQISRPALAYSTHWEVETMAGSRLLYSRTGEFCSGYR